MRPSLGRLPLQEGGGREGVVQGINLDYLGHRENFHKNKSSTQTLRTNCFSFEFPTEEAKLMKFGQST